MGQSDILEFTGEQRREFMRALLHDLRALELMLDEGRFEEGVARIGAEQEMFLVDRACHPAGASLAMLERLKDPHFTTELGTFQLEMNLDPQEFTGDCLGSLERPARGPRRARALAAHELGLEIVLTGILPTIRKSDLGLENMVPLARYKALNDATTRLRGEAYYIHINGIDELRTQHDSVMVEACNASFQMHLQVGAKDFANAYNVAQVLAGPVLAAATNSPLLFGRRLWAETRIALFQQAVDSRNPSQAREMAPRVTFGNRWVEKSVVELYQEDIARFRALVGTDLDEDPLAVLARGRRARAQGAAPPQRHDLPLEPRLLRHHQRQAAPAHREPRAAVRPEHRSTRSRTRAFWLGLMSALTHKYADITQGDRVRAREDELRRRRAPRARRALHLARRRGGARADADRRQARCRSPPRGSTAVGVAAADRDRYLGVIERRVRSGRTGSRWMLFSLAAMKDHGTQGERLNALTMATIARQRAARPVADWEPARLDEGGGWKHNYLKVEQYMTTDLYTVHPDEPVDLVAKLMEWHRIRHVPVEDHEHRLVGLVSYRSLLRLLADPALASRARRHRGRRGHEDATRSPCRRP